MSNKSDKDYIDTVLLKTETLVEKMTNIIKDLFTFMKKSLQPKELKKVFFLLFMSITMALFFLGIKFIFM